MKFATSLAIMALINNLSAIQCASLKDDDLFTDDGDVSTTLSSMKQAEKVHNTKFTGLNAEGQTSAITEKSAMTFSGDEFIKNDIKKFEKSFLQLEDRVFPEPRPIGEVMAQIGSGMGDFDEIKVSNMISRTAEEDQAVLGGSSLNDEEDMSTTMESIKTAEKMTGSKMSQVDSSKQNAAQVHNYLEDDHRIYTAELDNAMTDKDAVDAKARAAEQAKQQKQALVQQQQKQNVRREQKANADIAIHFMDDDFIQTHQDDSDSSDSDSDDE